MARVKIEEIVDDLSQEFKGALGDAVAEILPDTKFDEYELFRAFKSAISRKCSTWESVRNSHVKVRRSSNLQNREGG